MVIRRRDKMANQAKTLHTEVISVVDLLGLWLASEHSLCESQKLRRKFE